MTQGLRAIVESSTPAPNGTATHKLVFAGKTIRTLTGNGSVKDLLTELAAGINAPIDLRVKELLEANNREVARRRTAEDILRRLLIAVEQIDAEPPGHVGLDEDLYQAALSDARAVRANG